MSNSGKTKKLEKLFGLALDISDKTNTRVCITVLSYDGNHQKDGGWLSIGDYELLKLNRDDDMTWAYRPDRISEWIENVDPDDIISFTQPPKERVP